MADNNETTGASAEPTEPHQVHSVSNPDVQSGQGVGEPSPPYEQTVAETPRYAPPAADQNPAASQSPGAAQSPAAAQAGGNTYNPYAPPHYGQSQPQSYQQMPTHYAAQQHGVPEQHGGNSAQAPYQANETQSLQHGQPQQYAMNGAVFGAPNAEPDTQAPREAKRGHKTSTLIAGIAAAALVGGLVGGGVSSLVLANLESSDSVKVQKGGTVTLNNPDSVTEITGVASVATPSVVTLNVESQASAGSGSGVIYNDEGYIITNAHVVTLDGTSTSPKIRVKLSDGRVFDGELVGVAPYSDIAVVKIEADDLTPISVADSSKVNVGDLAVAIGAPMNLSNTVTSGVVSALNRGISVGSPLIPEDQSQDETDPRNGSPGFPWDFRFETPGQEQDTQQSVGQVTLPVIQTDASINPGNSGGALLNSKGELIGINVAIASPGASEGTASSAGLGFAIPAELATRVADEIIAGEKPSHGLLGASVVDSSVDTDADANYSGGLIQELVSGGAAQEAGLRVGDVITAIDGVPAADGTSVSALIRMHPGNSEITVSYSRGGNPGEVTVKLGELDW